MLTDSVNTFESVLVPMIVVLGGVGIVGLSIFYSYHFWQFLKDRLAKNGVVGLLQKVVKVLLLYLSLITCLVWLLYEIKLLGWILAFVLIGIPFLALLWNLLKDIILFLKNRKRIDNLSKGDWVTMPIATITILLSFVVVQFVRQHGISGGIIALIAYLILSGILRAFFYWSLDILEVSSFQALSATTYFRFWNLSLIIPLCIDCIPSLFTFGETTSLIVFNYLKGVDIDLFLLGIYLTLLLVPVVSSFIHLEKMHSVRKEIFSD